MKRANLYKAPKPMKVLKSECRDEVHSGYAESHKASVQNEQKSRHAALELSINKKMIIRWNQ